MVEERRVWRSKTTLVVCIIVIACLVGTNVWAYSENLRLQSQTASLEDQVSQLQSLNSTLQEEKSQLQNQINSLEAERSQLQSQVSSLETEKAQLENQVSSLQAEKSRLESQVSFLQTEKSKLQSQIDSLQAEKTQLQNQVSSLQTKISQLQSQVNNLEAEISQLQTQIGVLQAEIERLKAPKLVLVNLKADDVRPWLGTPYLHIYGEICNVGENTAYDSKLHVVAYQESVVAIDTYITLGSIEGESWKSVDEKIYYTGSQLTMWIITPEWTG